jgi:glycerophosphoryl diester phosphodiesterase
MKSRNTAMSLLLLPLCLHCSRPGGSLPFPGSETFDLQCPGVTPHAAGVRQFVIMGHRGAPRLAPENTILSMRAAMDEGANAVEVDLSMTKDGKVVLWHDWNPDDPVSLARQAGTEPNVAYRPAVPAIGDDMRRPIHELTLVELRAHYGYVSKEQHGERAHAPIPTVAEFARWAARESRLTHVLFDVKIPAAQAHLTEALVEQTASAVRGEGGKFVTVYSSPDEDVWEALSHKIQGDTVAFDVDPGVTVYDDKDCDDASSEFAVKRGGGYATTVRPASYGNEDWKSLKSLLSCDLEARDRAGGRVKKVFAATINDHEMMECLVDMGVDGVMTDDPRRLKGVVAAKRPSRSGAAKGASRHSEIAVAPVRVP